MRGQMFHHLKLGTLFEDIGVFFHTDIYRYQIGLYHLIKLFYLYHYSFLGKHFHLIHQAFPSIVYLLEQYIFHYYSTFLKKGTAKPKMEISKVKTNTDV